VKESVSVVLEELNRRLMSSPRGMFLTCIYLIVDSASGEVCYANAGHPPFLHAADSGVSTVEGEAGPPLGIMISAYPENRMKIEPGETILLLTDGTFDARGLSGQRIGMEKLLYVAGNFAGEENLVQVIADYVDNFSKGVERADDLTLVEVSRKK
jgi:serine phosphatase RsbU (regulator of sigma subunit)